MEESERSDAVRGFIGKGHVPTSKIYEYLDLKLVHGELGEVYSRTWRTRELIPEQYVNPLYFLLMKFCSASKLHSLVVRPHSVPPQKTKPQKAFEQHVAWVLSCYGFATIVLGARGLGCRGSQSQTGQPRLACISSYSEAGISERLHSERAQRRRLFSAGERPHNAV